MSSAVLEILEIHIQDAVLSCCHPSTSKGSNMLTGRIDHRSPVATFTNILATAAAFLSMERHRAVG